MKRHQGYYGGHKRGAKCTECSELVTSDAVLMQPVRIDDRGRANPTGQAIHGLLCMDCYDLLEVDV